MIFSQCVALFMGSIIVFEWYDYMMVAMDACVFKSTYLLAWMPHIRCKIIQGIPGFSNFKKAILQIFPCQLTLVLHILVGFIIVIYFQDKNENVKNCLVK